MCSVVSLEGEKIRRGTKDKWNCEEVLSFNSSLLVNSNNDNYLKTILYVIQKYNYLMLLGTKIVSVKDNI